MVSKKKIIKFKLNFHKSPRKKTPNASRMSKKNNSLPLMVNTKTLPRVHVSITPLVPTKMPDLAKNQYYNLVKSSGLLSVRSAEKSSWDDMSPEATPEREFGTSSRNFDLMSPTTRTQLQLSPFDLGDVDYTGLGNEPWSENSEPYPSPKSPGNNENEEAVCWFESPEVDKTHFFEHQEVVGLSRWNLVSPCDDEVEAVMARQNYEVPNVAPDIPVHQPQPSNDLPQTIIIPIQPEDKSPCSLDVSRGESPVFDRDEIWTSSSRKCSVEKTKEVGKGGLKRKRGRPKKKRKVPRLTTSMELSNPVDMTTSSSLPVNEVQGTEQDRKERITNFEEVTSCKTGTESPSKNRCVENGQCKILHDDPVPNNSVDFDFSNENARCTFSRPSEVEQHENLEEESSGILEKAVECNTSTLQESSRKSPDMTEDKRSGYRESYVNSQIGVHLTQGSRLPNEQTHLLSALETLSRGNDLDSMEEVASEQIPEEDDERVRETPFPTPSKCLSAVYIESSPLINSLELNEKMNEEKSPIKSTVFLTDPWENHQLSSNSESTNDFTPLERLCSFRQELFPDKELDTSTSVSNCQLRTRTLSETSELRESLRPLEVRLSASSSEDVPVLNKEDKSRECLRTVGGNKSLSRGLSVVCERLLNSVSESNDECSGSPLLENSASNENISIKSEVTKRQEATKRSLTFVRGCQSGKRSPPPRNRKLSVLCTNGKDKDSNQGQNKLLEGKVELIPCSPIRNLNLPVFEGSLGKRPRNFIGPSKSDTPYRTTSTTNSVDKEVSKTSSDRPKKKSLDNSLPHHLCPPLSSSKSNTGLLEGTVRLTPCSPSQTVKFSTMWKKGRGESSNSTVWTSPRLSSSLVTVSPSNAFKSPVPLKNLVVKCDRVPAGNYDILKSPENVLVKPTGPKRKRNRRKVDAENKDTDKKEERKTGTKRKRENKSNKSEKPKKKRKLSIPGHYKNYRPCQLSSISHTQMRYRVAFNLWPQKYSGALDRINQRIMNQNFFWKSLG